MISVKDLEFSYNHNRIILNNINFHAQQGLCTAILGNNGAGKSTLIKCLNRILEPKKGVVYVNNKNLQALNRNDIAKSMAYVAQHSSPDRFSVFDTVLLGRKPYIKFEPTKKDFDIVKTVINRMNLESLSLRYIDELSGGERQKVMIAQALAQQPKVLLLDEPTENLDINNQYEVLHTIQEIAKTENISVIIIIHDLNLALRYCDKFLLLKDSSIFCYGGAEIITPQNISEIYKIPVAIESVCGVKVVVPFPK